jgi:hypothetical protein
MTMPHPMGNPAGAKPAIETGRTQLRLDKGSHLRLRAAENMRLSAVRGIAWITVEREAGETMVRPGDAFVVSSGKTALIGPLRESVTLELGAAPDVPERVANRPVLARLRRLFRLEHGFDFGGV